MAGTGLVNPALLAVIGRSPPTLQLRSRAMHLVTRVLAGATALALVGATTVQAQVGLTSNGPVTVALNATRNTSIALSTDVPSASLASITDNSTNNNFSGINVTATWALTGGTTLNLVGWFTTPA